ncbi:NUDIX hydrolase [Streptomyces sp. NBC_01361]|uniref:NUDIX hydrolase n=1 Tax=Streptomyces sp. NBC_01361 TaxID=2903838 RepID=UPI002E37BAF2|nr:NUDIX hydrolase [Streptomyces sp. NBC_01361]
MTAQPNLTALAPLARVIADTVQETPIRLGTPAGATDLIQQLIIKTSAYMGSQLPTTPGLTRHMVDLDSERQRQLDKFGDQHHPNGTGLNYQRSLANEEREVCDAAFRNGRGTWRHILAEEVAEAFAEKDPANLRAELVQVSAVCAAWIADIDSRPTP